ncbi:MAG: 2-succinyl-5-enolpyruvyl-6-hydroxy-3-cyclohexene-1-carboxylic-acid synthase [Flavobacteriales bacterium]|nr:MAG: 2-succinyl-5-enolpyruvyl-6-hydroxy-3-cyclohexene-1-carboxylic-acid synthase [Flavobacteriales bacterium]
MVKHGGFFLHSFPDERAAAFAALGAAQGSRYPTGVICTSGTAAANLYPAVCEAFYQRLPLLVITADRPTELINQWDGQTIYQDNLFHPHTQGNFALPAIAPTQDIPAALGLLQTTVQTAIAQTLYPVPGPVHINVPLRDPIYADVDKPFQHITPTKPLLIHHTTPPPVSQTQTSQWFSHTDHQQPRILIVVGMHHPQPELSLALQSLQTRLPIFTDIISQQHPYGIDQWDRAMLNNTPDHRDFRPDLLITLGMGVVSKPLKQWLKANKPQKHIHISPLQAPVGDPFQTNPEHLQHHEVDALFAMDQALQDAEPDTNFLNLWQNWVTDTLSSLGDGLPNDIEALYKREFAVVKNLLSDCDARFVIQLGNSMSVRYASWSGSSEATLYANRGTSGIDGSLSTAVGYAIAHPDIHCVALLGDVSALYDAHAFWTAELPKNFSVVVLNNGGGQIFNWIGGPSVVQDLMPLIETPHHFDFKHLCDLYQIQYQRHKDHPDTTWTTRFLNQSGCTLWEV